MTATPITPFSAEFETHGKDGHKKWKPCEVVGIHAERYSPGHFIVMHEDDDGMLWPIAVESVRRKAA